MKKEEKKKAISNNKKGVKKQEKKGISQENAPITLPPFGLAEDILGIVTQENVDELELQEEKPISQGKIKKPKKQKKEKKKKKEKDEQNEKREEITVNDTEQIEQEEKEDEEIITFITFFLDKEEYGLPISQVQEINRVTEITRVPNAPEHVKGVINLRGRIVPVIELKRRLSLGKTTINKESRVVLAEQGVKVIGLMVDRVAQVLNISTRQIEEAPEEMLAQFSENYVKGIGKIEERIIILLELNSILHRKEDETT